MSIPRKTKHHQLYILNEQEKNVRKQMENDVNIIMVAYVRSVTRSLSNLHKNEKKNKIFRFQSHLFASFSNFFSFHFLSFSLIPPRRHNLNIYFHY